MRSYSEKLRERQLYCSNHTFKSDGKCRFRHCMACKLCEDRYGKPHGFHPAFRAMNRTACR